jgi:heme oxygenase
LSAHAALKAATRKAHDQLDAHFSGYDLAEPGDYARFLTAHAAAFLPIEDALDRAGAARLLADWPTHRRRDALVADLDEMGLAIPVPVGPPPYADDEALLGGLYVIEGSRLGGAVLTRAVGDGLPRRFLSAPQEKGRWRRFIATLDQFLYPGRSLSRAGDAALATFACFEQAIMVTRK